MVLDHQIHHLPSSSAWVHDSIHETDSAGDLNLRPFTLTILFDMYVSRGFSLSLTKPNMSAGRFPGWWRISPGQPQNVVIYKGWVAFERRLAPSRWPQPKATGFRGQLETIGAWWKGLMRSSLTQKHVRKSWFFYGSLIFWVVGQFLDVG
jgi:hypothetical protein